ncbi:hypothetical protein B0H67DRAFT_649793 [Lasiosphaeris hirsuta]|uniref:Fungal N-terminal domain-containing protein n=1 Tax=Lasiosphaeris hirsuta TaxID=260670 RepID=A0AA39ZXI0_9PEZI|nr:hypothetical protein B0H67DRAFT_649793 [Lasiosphaeris hirsuta]
MILLELLEILEGLAILQRITSIAWLNHDAHNHYQEFREEIATLGQNLNALHDVVRQVHSGPGAYNHHSVQKSPATESLTRVLSGFRDTLNECWELLDKRRAYGESRGAINNWQWHLFVKDDLAIFRDRIAVHNIKLSMALNCLNITNFDHLRTLILSTAEWLGRQIHHEQVSPETVSNDRPTISECRPSTPQLAASTANLIPDLLHRTLTAIMKRRHGSLTSIPLADGVDEAVFHLDRATKKFQENDDHVHTFSSILRAYWLLKATEMTDEYRTVVAHPSFVEFETQLAQFGMTLPLFFARLEDKILLAHQGALRDKPGAPTVYEIQDRIEKDKNRWLEYRQSGPRRDNLDPRQGGKVMQCQLHCEDTDAEKHVEVYQNGEGSLTLIIRTSSCSDNMIYKTDLNLVHFGAHPNSSLSKDSYSVTIKQNRTSTVEVPDTITFLQDPDLFSFQESVTGYKIVDNLPGARVICQFSRGDRKWVLWKGVQRAEIGRIQLWTSSNRSSSVRNSVLGRVSKSDPNLKIDGSGYSTPTSSGSDSRVGSRQYVQLQDGNFGTILETPECPCLVIFLADMLLVIKVNDDVKIRPDRCRCQPEVDEDPKESDCKEVVIKGTSKYINARSATAIDPIAGYNIASAGRYQRRSLTKVEKLTLVIIEFGSVEGRACKVRRSF